MSTDEYIEVDIESDSAKSPPAASPLKIVAVANRDGVFDNNGKPKIEVIDVTSYQNLSKIASSAAIDDSICLICEGPANGIHFRAQSCAACNAFFRRSVAEKRRYVCREDGNCNIHYKQRCLCRACRLKKCLAVGMDPSAVQPQRDSIGSKKHLNKLKKHTPKNDNPELIETEPSTINASQSESDVTSVSPCTYYPNSLNSYQYAANVESDLKELEESVVIECGNLIEEVLCCYQQLQERRRLLYCPRTLRDLLSGTVPTFKKVECFFSKDNFNAEVANIVEFLRNVQPFLVFDIDNQLALMRNFCLPMTIIEKYYMTYRQGGHLNNCIYHQNYSYRDLNEEATIDENEAKQKHNISLKTIVEINIPYMKKAINDICLPMASIGMTDVEIVGLMLIMLFDANAPDLTEPAKKIVKAIRDRVYEDWFAIYNHNGIKNGAEKVGNVVLLTSAVQEFAKLIPHNFHFVRVFGLTDYDELLNDVFLNNKNS